jgi:hypothetical protein
MSQLETILTNRKKSKETHYMVMTDELTWIKLLCNQLMTPLVQWTTDPSLVTCNRCQKKIEWVGWEPVVGSIKNDDRAKLT